jgi:hypothetical protein
MLNLKKSLAPVAAVDVDGVLLNCDHSFAQVAGDLLGRKLHALNNAYNLATRYGITEKNMFDTFEFMEVHPLGWGGMEALSGAIEAVKHLQDIGYFVHLVTAIPQELSSLRLSCLKAYDFVPDNIYCAGSHLASKTEALREMNPVMMVDDRLLHLHGAPFIPYRVWVDHGDEQDGLIMEKGIYRVGGISEWVDELNTLNLGGGVQQKIFHLKEEQVRRQHVNF